ncbi:hypothetical protein PFMC_04085 [Plasmodium falciparum CAMP/Malaysia]|uniref:Uncharacterized protein n=1 Tax=Plasmodium falciparum (isolate Camp / Malaysia) TaxID=5835 RepID=A0A024X3I1_PLAFC|nr:hypothetical protein PFMC_04085 [Plasmodium falciparum CAMP/Malaysia]
MKNQFLKEYKGTSFIFLYYILNKHVMKENLIYIFFFHTFLVAIIKNLSLFTVYMNSF